MPESAAPTAVVCDDASGQRDAVCQVLIRAGYLVIETATVGQLRDRVIESQPDLVVLDLAKSGRQGLAVVAELRALSPLSAVIALSPFEGLRAAARAAGAEALVDGADLRDLQAVLVRLHTPTQRTPPSEVTRPLDG